MKHFVQFWPGYVLRLERNGEFQEFAAGPDGWTEVPKDVADSHEASGWEVKTEGTPEADKPEPKAPPVPAETETTTETTPAEPEPKKGGRGRKKTEG